MRKTFRAVNQQEAYLAFKKDLQISQKDRVERIYDYKFSKRELEGDVSFPMPLQYLDQKVFEHSPKLLSFHLISLETGGKLVINLQIITLISKIKLSPLGH